MDEKSVKDQFQKPAGNDGTKPQSAASSPPLTREQQARADEINEWIREIKKTNRRGNYNSYGRCPFCGL